MQVASINLPGPKGQRFDYLTMDDEDQSSALCPSWTRNPHKSSRQLREPVCNTFWCVRIWLKFVNSVVHNQNPASNHDAGFKRFWCLSVCRPSPTSLWPTLSSSQPYSL